MPAQLISLTEGPSILLDKPILLIGRDAECDIQIDSRKVSRRHCCIAQVSDYLVVRDLGSTNGIRINGVRVVEGRLRADDELTIGANRYRISWDVVTPAGRRMEDEIGRVEEALSRPVAPEDELLESCDEPIPLPDPRKPSRVASSGKLPAVEPGTAAHKIIDSPAALPSVDPRDTVKRNAPQTPESNLRPSPSDEILPVIIPDNLTLAPMSDDDLRRDESNET